MARLLIGLAAGALLAGCDPNCSRQNTPRIEALDAQVWEMSEWISVADAPVAGKAELDSGRAADGASCFVRRVTNAKRVVSAKWMTAGLGVYELFVNGQPVGKDFLKPGFTHWQKTKYSFTYDVTALLGTGTGEANDFGAEVSSGWWRDQIVGQKGQKSAFRAVLELKYDDGTAECIGTKAGEWFGEIAGPVTHAGIFDGEEFDARQTNCARTPRDEFTPGGCERNDEFGGEILPTDGAEVCLRWDLSMRRGPLALRAGEDTVVDFGQNCAAVPFFRFRAKRGTVLTILPGEMLNDADEGQRGCDGPKGSVFRLNLRNPGNGMRFVYTFAGEGPETYLPCFSYCGYRYVSLSATDEVEIEEIASVPVTSVTKQMESGSVTTGDAAVNRLIANAYWSQLSNYLSVPTDCPQRNERLGWSADAQIFSETGCYNADVLGFFRKYLRDHRDTLGADGGYMPTAPYGQYTDGLESYVFGWADAGVILPYRVWQMYGDTCVIAENFDAMARFVRTLDETKYDFEGKRKYLYADWLSYQTFETCGNSFGDWFGKWQNDPDARDFRRFLAACYWRGDALMLSEMAQAIGRADDSAWFRSSAERAREYIRGRFLESDGLLLRPMRDLQSACVFALHFGIVEGAARQQTMDILRASIREHGDCLQTGILATGYLMDTLTDCGLTDVAYTLLLQHKNPSWLYSVDQGATTIWERWDSYTVEGGFSRYSSSMNSFNHYAYGSVVAWLYRVAAGIATDPSAPGFGRLVLKPRPDRRLGSIKAEFRTAHGLVKSAWRYEGDRWIWDFTVPEGVTALVSAPGREAKNYSAGTYRICAP